MSAEHATFEPETWQVVPGRVSDTGGRLRTWGRGQGSHRALHDADVHGWETEPTGPGN
jgi:hypothetical protein